MAPAGNGRVCRARRSRGAILGSMRLPRRRRSRAGGSSPATRRQSCDLPDWRCRAQNSRWRPVSGRRASICRCTPSMARRIEAPLVRLVLDHLEHGRVPGPRGDGGPAPSFAPRRGRSRSSWRTADCDMPSLRRAPSRRIAAGRERPARPRARRQDRAGLRTSAAGHLVTGRDMARSLLDASVRNLEKSAHAPGLRSAWCSRVDLLALRETAGFW